MSFAMDRYVTLCIIQTLGLQPKMPKGVELSEAKSEGARVPNPEKTEIAISDFSFRDSAFFPTTPSQQPFAVL